MITYSMIILLIVEAIYFEVGLYLCGTLNDKSNIPSWYMQAVLVIDPFLHSIGFTVCLYQQTNR